MSVQHKCAWCLRRAERVLCPLELESRVVVRHHLVARSIYKSSARASVYRCQRKCKRNLCVYNFEELKKEVGAQ